MPFDAFEFQIDGLLDSIHVCLERQHFVPALMLMYAAIDGMAWCVRKNPNGNVTQDDFTAWVETYMFEGHPAVGELRAVDLYAARCGILHSQIAESTKSQQGAAREINYETGDRKAIVSLGLNSPNLPLFVPIDWLMATFEAGIARFRNAVGADVALKAVVEQETLKYLVPVRF